MRKYFTILLLALFLIACSGNKPESIAESFVTELAKGEFETAQTFCTPEIAQLVEEMSALSSSTLENPNFRFTFLRKEQTDELLTVYYENENGQERKIGLKEIDGKWRIAVFTLYL